MLCIPVWFRSVGGSFLHSSRLLMDEKMRKQTLNLHFPEIVPPTSSASEQIPICQTVAELCTLRIPEIDGKWLIWNESYLMFKKLCKILHISCSRLYYLLCGACFSTYYQQHN